MKRSALKRTELRRKTPFRSTASRVRDLALPKHGRSRIAKTIPVKVRQEVADRSGFVCELGCGTRAVHMHHRRMRSQQGRHEAVNLIHTCSAHHVAIHANPARSYALGWLVRSGFDPADVPVLKGDLT